MALWRSIFGAGFAVVGVACSSAPPILTPSAPAAPVCPIEGCASPTATFDRISVGPPLCAAAGEAACGGAAAGECARRALDAWSVAQDDRALGCVARMLEEACSLGEAHACGYAGRMWIDGRGIARNVGRGMAMLVQACDDGVAVACIVGARWLAEPLHARELPDAAGLRSRLELEHACVTGEPPACYQMGLRFYFGRNAFPQDHTRASLAYERGCDLGDARACNNLGDALAYGEGAERNVARSAKMFERACRLGEALGCANSGYMFEHGEGTARSLSRARELYRDSCVSGEVYGCLHAEMMAAQDAGAPRDPQRALAHWRRGCAFANARACAFVGVIYEDGPDGLTRDIDKSLEAMNRACGLGDPRACEWVKEHPQ